MKNGERWQAGKLVATREQVQKEREEFEAKIKKREEASSNEDTY